ncbi:MAG: GGDEF domain-containing protein, partial [Planctomycetota bacterium]|jgi:predicted signal transduction protein with EAL and GGDEF domain
MKEIRKYDSAYRYGGEEISVLLPETETEDALEIAERIRSRIEKNKFRGDRSQPISVTISIGVSSFAQGMASPSDLIASADAALYRAKEGGRNRVEIGGETTTTKKKSRRRSGSKKAGGRKKATKKSRKKAKKKSGKKSRARQKSS